ncbi:hypothetical protein [Oharaeibacter diazotrophicus]|uniref:Uncharacterized protein n=1 Tax=Oharaeibacter diazotrophicus TaxID=1920512 RepID=A0A4R6RA93_9HYPH|nr:hypothetical protein [Oharaeibacter diazotrophicus]TDP82557.1 hypothetical protein EDD54_3826 [Oharaeibacter diazotrophicus]BBE72679.1 hypothetical protein OHA_1_02277 [Pleomorphomonas sp. SM30]GLS76713.1 hypothetical protein GCM10007904_20500 [Oharaeibacter diazotrophicus]
MKYLAAASFAILALSVGAASAASVTYYDPAEAEFRTDQVNPNPAPVTVAAPAAQTVDVYDPAEAEFTKVPMPQAGSVITTHAPAAPARNGGWDPADN